MKILKNTMVETKIGFPSEFTAKTEAGEEVVLSYRHGRVKILINEEVHSTVNGPENEFDVGGVCSIEEMVMVLEREELLGEC